MPTKKRLKAQPHEAYILSTTRSQFQVMSTPQTSSTPSTPHKYQLSSEWIHTITILLGHPLKSVVGQHIQKWIICQANLGYTNVALRWDPIQFEDNKHLQKYEETNGSTSCLLSNTVKQLVNLKIYMFLLIIQDRPAGQNYNPFHSNMGEQLIKLTSIDMKTALINEMLENSRSNTTPREFKSMITSPSSSVSMRFPIHLEPNSFKKGIIPDDPPQDVNKYHPNLPTSQLHYQSGYNMHIGYLM